jgi:hypothetical protein
MSKELTNVQMFSEIAPTGARLSYLLSDEGRVYASAKSWSRALDVPECMLNNFMTGIARMALMKKDSAGGSLEMIYRGTPVYRWHAVAAQLRSFDREFSNSGYRVRPPAERRELEKFHENYERLTNWGYDLQERAIAALLNAKSATPAPTPGNAVTPDALVEALKQAVAPRLHAHDDKLKVHDALIGEIKVALPALRDSEEFISVRQAIYEQGLDPTIMPLHPRSNENLSGLAGQILKSRRAEEGSAVVARLDGNSVKTTMNRYKRGKIYAVLEEIMNTQQKSFPL